MGIVWTALDFVTSIPFKANTNIQHDYLVFRLHHRYTANGLFLLALSSAIVMDFDWIHCYSSRNVLSTEVLNTYCWMQNTFVLPRSSTVGRAGVNYAHPGVAKANTEDEKNYINYYQWIPLFLLGQGLLFKIPHQLWKRFERNCTQNLAAGFQFPLVKRDVFGPPIAKDDFNRRLKLLAEHISDRWSTTNINILFYFFCVTLNLVNVIGNIFLLDVLLNTKIAQNEWNLRQIFVNYYTRSDTLLAAFPRVVKCSYFDYGAGGSVQNYEIVCLLPFNVYSEVFFTLIFTWYVTLSVLTGLDFTFWLLTIMCPPMRRYIGKCPPFFNKSVRDLMDRVEHNMGDWYFMMLLSKNMHNSHLVALVQKLHSQLPVKKTRRQLFSIEAGNEADLLTKGKQRG